MEVRIEGSRKLRCPIGPRSIASSARIQCISIPDINNNDLASDLILRSLGYQDYQVQIVPVFFLWRGPCGGWIAISVGTTGGGGREA
jgi:hypothetical protein